MANLLRTSLLLSSAAAVVSASTECMKAVSWSDPRVDLFGLAPDNSIWHKFYTGYDWQPEKFERIPSEASSCPAVSSWGHNRLDIVWVNKSDKVVMHKWFGGGSWGPSWEDANDLGGAGDMDQVETTSWGDNRLDIIANAADGTLLHKAWTGTDYYPSGKKWEDLGGNFTGVMPSLVSRAENRLDIVGIDAESRSVMHKYWDGTKWSDWADMGGPFIGKPVVTSWGIDRLDIWALDEKAQLNHKYWDGHQWNDWEKMGGKFAQTPKVVHWAKDKIDIVGRNVDDNSYYLKDFDGDNWHPSLDGYYDLSGPYESEPVLLPKKGQSFLYLFGIDTNSDVRMQIWSGYEWQPGSKKTWPLGNVAKPYPDEKTDAPTFGTPQVVLGSEL